MKSISIQKGSLFRQRFYINLRVGPWPGFCTSTQGLHSFIASLSVLVSSLFSHGPSLWMTKHGIHTFVLYFEFFIVQKSSLPRGGSRNGFTDIYIVFSFSSADIHVWLPSQWYPSRNTLGDIWSNPSFLSDHCSQFILEDFSLVYLLVFPSWPLAVCSSSAGTWDVGSERGLSGQDLTGDASRVRDSQK